MTNQTIPILVNNVALDRDIRKLFTGWYITSSSSENPMPMDSTMVFSDDRHHHAQAYLHIHYETNQHGYYCGVQLFVAHPKLVETLCFRIGYKLNVIYEMSSHSYMDYLREVQSESFHGDKLAALRRYIKDHPADYVETNPGYVAMLEAGRQLIK